MSGGTEEMGLNISPDVNILLWVRTFLVVREGQNVHAIEAS